MKFDVQRAVTPARAALPKLKDFASGPSPGPPRKRLASAEFVLCVYKLAPDASVLWDDVNEALPLWQVQFEHSAKDSLLINFYDRFVQFLRETEGSHLQKAKNPSTRQSRRGTPSTRKRCRQSVRWAHKTSDC